MKNLLLELAKSISDSGNEIASKIVTYMGYTGAGITTGQAVVQNPKVQSAIPVAQEIANTCSESPTWLIYIPAVMAATLIFKHGSDFYFRRKEHQKVMNEKSTNKDNIC